MFINLIRDGQRVLRIRRDDPGTAIVEELGYFPSPDAIIGALIIALLSVVDQLNAHSPVEELDIPVPSGG